MEEYDDRLACCPLCGYCPETKAKESFCLSPGTILRKRYIIGRVIGYDSLEAVYIAYDAQTDRKAAVREYLPERLSARAPGLSELTVYKKEADGPFAKGLLSFTDDAGQLEKLDGIPGLPSVRESFYDNNTEYIVTEYKEGRSLPEILGDKHVLGYEHAREITLRILHTIKAVRAAGIVYFSVSPESVYIANDGEVLLLGFGVRHLASDSWRVHPWADSYATASVLYYMLTGAVPPDSPVRASRDVLGAPSKKGASLPKKAEAAIMAALRPDMDMQNGTQSIAALESALLNADSGRKDGFPAWGKVVIIGGVVLLLTVGSVVMLNVFAPDKSNTSSDSLSDQTEPTVESSADGEALGETDTETQSTTTPTEITETDNTPSETTEEESSDASPTETPEGTAPPTPSPTTTATITPSFSTSPQSFKVTLTIDPNEGGTASTSEEAMGVCIAGKTYGIVAVPARGYQFVKWFCNDDLGHSMNYEQASTTYTMPDKNITITAIFAPK